MQKRLSAFLCLWMVVLGGAEAFGYIANERWNRTATNSSTGSQGTPVTLTWGFAPDGTTIPDSVSSNLLNFLDTNFGTGPGGSDLTLRPWYTHFAQSTRRIGELSGLTFVYEPNDDGRSFSSSTSARGVLGTRADIRIGGKSYGSGSNILASNFYPDYGEMMINTDKASYFTNSSSSYLRLRNTLMHELMHGLGISHVESSNAGFLIEPILSNAFDGPQLDDLLAIQRLYGDVYEKSGGNDTYTNAVSLGGLSPASPLTIGTGGDSTVIADDAVDFLSIDDNSDTDFFSFSISERLDVHLLLTPRGASYQVGPQDGTQSTYNSRSLSDLSLALLDTNGTSLLASADNNAIGSGEAIQRQLLPGTYYARVQGAQNDIQLYGLGLIGAVPLPAQLVWVGNLSSDWAVGVANFEADTSPTAFYDGDHVTFTDSSPVKAVNLPGVVAAGDMVVDSDVGYVFSGPGRIVADTISIDGLGVVELATQGGSSFAAANVNAGTLRLSGEALLAGNVHVSEAAKLDVAGGQPFDVASTLTGDGLIAGDVAMPGTIAPGSSIGSLTFTGDLALAGTSRLEIELAGLNEIAEYDALRIAGAANLDGILDVALAGEFLPAAGTLFEVLRAEAGIFFEFDHVALPALASDLAWKVIYSNFAVLLQVIAINATELPGDFNHDDRVDAADYIVWRKGLGTTHTLEQYEDWRTHFGETVSAAGGGSTVNFSSTSGVPEPATLVLALLSSIMGLRLRRR